MHVFFVLFKALMVLHEKWQWPHEKEQRVKKVVKTDKKTSIHIFSFQYIQYLKGFRIP